MKKKYAILSCHYFLNIIFFHVLPLHGMNHGGHNSIAFFISTSQMTTKIIDYETQDKKKAIYYDFLHALLRKNYAHIFVPYSLWQRFATKNLNSKRYLYERYAITQPSSQIKIENYKPFSVDETTNQTKSAIKSKKIRKKLNLVLAFKQDEWTAYDSNIGLVYIKKCGIPQTVINTHEFKHMLAPLYYKLSDNTNEWINNLDRFIISPQQHPLKIYFTGHGNETSSEIPRIAGLMQTNISKIIDHFNRYHPHCLVAIDSCYSPACRITQFQKLPISCTILTSMRTFTVSNSYEPLIKNYEPSIVSNKRKLELCESTSLEKESGTINEFIKEVFNIIAIYPETEYEKKISQAFIEHEQHNSRENQPSLLLAGTTTEFNYPNIDQIAKKTKIDHQNC